MLKKLTDRIYYMPNVARTDRPVIGLICGDKWSLVVDAGNSSEHAKDFLKCALALNISPIKFLAITHWHWDHVFGIGAMNLICVCHYKTKEHLDKMQSLKWDDYSLDERVKNGEEIEFCSERIKLEMPSRDDFKTSNADIVFNQSLKIDLGGINCIIENVGGDHAEDSSIVYVPEQKTMFLGDSLCEDFYSGDWSYNKNKLKSMINKIKKYDAEYYIISHDKPKSKDEIWNFLDKLMNIGELVGDEVSTHKAVEKYTKKYNKAPCEDEIYYINTFINGNKKAKR